MRTSPHVPICQKAYKSYRMSFFEKVKMYKVSCKAGVIKLDPGGPVSCRV